MREIKFRAWDNENKVMEYNVNVNQGKPVKRGYQWFDKSNTVRDSDLMQYTGSKTRSGTEVYEGDVLSLQAHQDHYVDFHSCGFVGKSTNKVQRINWIPAPLWKLIEMGYEVTGNIYENPIKE